MNKGVSEEIRYSYALCEKIMRTLEYLRHRSLQPCRSWEEICDEAIKLYEEEQQHGIR